MTRHFVRLGGNLRGPTVEARSAGGTWIVVEDGDELGRVVGDVVFQAAGYSWSTNDGVAGESLTLAEAVAQLLGAEVIEVLG